jgi:hypothetical protein
MVVESLLIDLVVMAEDESVFDTSSNGDDEPTSE